MEDMHTSTLHHSFLRCGHAMHTKCLNQYMKANKISCPMCKKSVVDPKIFEAQCDHYFATMPMPLEYKDTKMSILCNDCLTKSSVKFHIDGGKCDKCRSYNTTRCVGEAPVAPTVVEAEADVTAEHVEENVVEEENAGEDGEWED